MPTQQCVANDTSALLTFPVGGASTFQLGARKARGVKQESARHSKDRSRSHHVEAALERILAKRQDYQEQEALRHLDLDEGLEAQAEQSVNESIS